jgi:hypothetical protein
MRSRVRRHCASFPMQTARRCGPTHERWLVRRTILSRVSTGRDKRPSHALLLLGAVGATPIFFVGLALNAVSIFRADRPLGIVGLGVQLVGGVLAVSLFVVWCWRTGKLPITGTSPGEDEVIAARFYEERGDQVAAEARERS